MWALAFLPWPSWPWPYPPADSAMQVVCTSSVPSKQVPCVQPQRVVDLPCRVDILQVGVSTVLSSEGDDDVVDNVGHIASGGKIVHTFTGKDLWTDSNFCPEWLQEKLASLDRSENSLQTSPSPQLYDIEQALKLYDETRSKVILREYS
ncbi:hypothetical protein SELMODRAFT_406480 [Selaginella moellendorffii]|uniref:Uncharacterized protein n=1 Tax=Selaginella moellendorffii TaxID=88036 RepID=D8R2H8_SELML|nr:hypothetical protein SELMODRAFT_406480 [Selaginella moellendorffii]